MGVPVICVIRKKKRGGIAGKERKSENMTDEPNLGRHSPAYGLRLGPVRQHPAAGQPLGNARVVDKRAQRLRKHYSKEPLCYIVT